MHFVGVCKKLQSTLLLYYICKCLTNTVMKENSFISLGQESDCMVWIRWQKATKTPDGRSTKARWASMGISSVHRCQQMPTKLSISDGDFSAISWNCLHGLSVMGGVPSVPYTLPNSLIILTAKACMKLYLIVWLPNALTSVMLESTLEIKLMQFCHSFFLSNISVNDSSSPILEISEFEIHSHLLN